MPEPTSSTTPPVADPTPTTPPVVEPTTEPQEEFDKERAMATIKNLRAFEKRAKELEKLVAENEAREKKRKESELSETEKLKNQLAEKDVALAELQKKQIELTRNRAIESEAAKPKWGKPPRPFLKPEQARALIDVAEITSDGDKWLGIEDLLKQLADENDHLLGGVAKPVMPSTDSTTANGKPDPDARANELAQRFRIKIPGR